MRVAANEESVSFPISWSPGDEGLHLIFVKMPATEVAVVTPGCHVEGVNMYRGRVQGRPITTKGCNVVLSNPVKKDEGLYETRDFRINGTSIPGSQIKLIFEDHSRSGASKTAANNTLPTYGATFLAVYMLRFLL